MKNFNVSIGLVVGSIAAIVSGCATDPSNSSLMRDHRSDVEVRAQAESDLRDRLAQDWDDGQELIASGNKNIEDGEEIIESAEKELKKGKNQVELGKRELAEGTELVRNSESRFRDEFGDVELSGSK